MKKVYRVYSLSSKEVCIPSTDYYARSNDWHTDILDVIIRESRDFNSLEEAEKFIEELFEDYSNEKTDFEIKIVYVKR